MSMKMEELLQPIDAASGNGPYRGLNIKMKMQKSRKKLQPIHLTADRRGVMYGRNCAAESRIEIKMKQTDRRRKGKKL